MSKLRKDGDCEHLNWKDGMMATNVELETNNDSEHQNETIALNVKLKKWLWTPNGKMNNDSEHQIAKKRWLWMPNWK